ncbi:MAG: L-histidine N(alpha)-methyltransferase [Sulfurimonas sp.]|nr:L-histidine N(alpha)-methyltransferase [Sulfurimonas sp.]
MDKKFAKDIKKGLTSKNKFIPDRQYYDEKGSEFFQELMSSPDYYVTDCELEIFESYKTEICKKVSSEKKINIIEKILNPNRFIL